MCIFWHKPLALTVLRWHFFAGYSYFSPERVLSTSDTTKTGITLNRTLRHPRSFYYTGILSLSSSVQCGRDKTDASSLVLFAPIARALAYQIQKCLVRKLWLLRTSQYISKRRNACCSQFGQFLSKIPGYLSTSMGFVVVSGLLRILP